MENNDLKQSLENMNIAQKEMRTIVDSFFTAGGYEYQMALLCSTLQDIVNKGSGEENNSLDNDFDYTNRYIRESVYEITELQKFLINLRETHLQYKKSCDYLLRNQIAGSKFTFVKK